MKETEVGEVRVYSDNEGGDVDVKVSVVDWGRKHSVAVRISVEGPAAGFWIDFTDDDAGEVIRLLQAGNLARSGVIRDRYDTKPLDGVNYLDGTQVQDFDLQAVRRVINQRFKADPGQAGETARQALVLKLILEAEDLSDALSAARVWTPEGALAPIVEAAPELPIFKPPAYEIGDDVLAAVNIERQVMLGTPGKVTGTEDGLTVTWGPSTGALIRAVDPAHITLAKPRVAPVAARIEEDD